MKNLILTLILTLFCCSSAYAQNDSHSFQKTLVTKSDNQLIKYKTELANNFTLTFYVDTKTDRAVPILMKASKKYQPISIRYCVVDSDDCWRTPLYDEYFADFAQILDRKEREPLDWQIEYIDNNRLNKTDLAPIPQLGTLSSILDRKDNSNTSNSDDLDNTVIIWQSDLTDY